MSDWFEFVLVNSVWKLSYNVLVHMVPACLRQCKRQTVWSYTVKQSDELVINNFAFTTYNWCISAFQTCYMFKIRLKVTQNYIFAQLTNSF